MKYCFKNKWYSIFRLKETFYSFLFQLFIIILLFSCTSQSQSSVWYLTRGEQNQNQAWGVDIDSAGFIYLSSCEIQLYSWFWDIFLYKFSADGKQIFRSEPYGGLFNDKAFITIVKSPYVFVAGRTDTSVNLESANILVLAYDIYNGRLLWEFKWDQGYGYEEVDGLKAEEDGIYISGWTKGKNTNRDIVILKLDYYGHLVWYKTWGSPGYDESNGQIVIDDSTIYVAGRYNGLNDLFGGDALLAAFSKTNGNYKWHTTWGSTNYDNAFGMTSSENSYLYCTGLTTSYGNGGQIFLLKYTKTGNLVWSSIWGGTEGESARAIVTDGDSIIYIAGKTDSYGIGNNDIVLLKYNKDGNLLKYKTWGGSGNDEAHGIALFKNYLYIAGETGSINKDHQNSVLIKCDGRNMKFPEMTNTIRKINSDFSRTFLFQNYPNPFNNTTIIEFYIEKQSKVEIVLYTILGKKIATLVNSILEKGLHSIPANFQDLPNGIYFFTFQAGNYKSMQKIILIK